MLKNTDEGTKRRLEVEFHNRSGDTRWALVSVTATKFENRPTWLATAIDITERKTLGGANSIAWPFTTR